MDVDNYIKKFKLLFENVFEGIIVINEYNMEKLLTFLEDGNENNPGRLVLKAPGFYNVLLTSLKNINDAPDTLKVFLVKIVTILYNQQSTKIKPQNFHTLIYTFNNLNYIPSHNLHLPCIKLATALIYSELGLIIEHKLWTKILYPNIHHKPKYISTAVYDFMAKLIWKLNEENLELALQEVLGHILEPILSSEYFSVPVLDTETDIELSDKIYPNISALIAVLAESDHHPHLDRVRSLLKEYFLIDHRLFDIFHARRNSNVLKLLNSCLFRYFLLMHRHLLFSNRTDEFCNKMTAFHRNYISQTAIRRDAFLIVDYVTQSTIIWSHFEKVHKNKLKLPLTFERNGETLEFSLQIVVHLIMPMVKYAALYWIVNKVYQRKELTDEIEVYVQKMTRTLADYIYTSCYVLGTFLEEGSPTFRKKLTTYTLKELLRLRGHITVTQAGPLFQSLYYMLDVFIKCDGTNVVVTNENPMDADDLVMLSHLLNAMKMLLKEHNIPWYENLEVVCVQSHLLNLLKQNILTIKHLVQVLDLINICVMKFLSPNMSLLVEGKGSQESTLSQTGRIIEQYMRHDDWEVRDAALNILNTCTEISFIKYIPLQKVITDNNLIILVAKIALSDPEFYSQCTALKCLTAATKIDSIWQEVLVDNPNIYLHLVHILRNHGEGMVRKEVVNVLTGVYANQKVTPKFESTLHEVMLLVALDDLHWEVQIAALNFWKKAIHNHLIDRGMLDGKFPPVTFSKEKRKIVVFNDVEIQRQLTAILNYLSNIGCLTVLLECTNEIHSIMVIDLAYSVAKEIIDILDTYHFEILKDKINVKPVDVSIQHKRKQNNSLMDFDCLTSEEERNKIINNILSINQAELIEHLYENYHQTNMEDMDIDFECSPRKELIRPNTFLEHFRSNDYSAYKCRKVSNSDYFCTLDQLLDEILDIEIAHD